MAKAGKKYNEAKAKIDVLKKYPIEEAVNLLKEVSYSKFGWTVEIAFKTFANPKYNDQMIRSTIVLPHGTGKKVKVAAFVSDDKRDDAKNAGADIVGWKSDLLKDIQDGKLDFDVLVTTPDQMRDLAPVAKVLGPRGMMPSPKAGTVSPNLVDSIEAIKKGRIEFRLDKTGNIHAILGKTSFDDEKLVENIQALIKAIMDNKPVGVKGKLIKKAVISSTMSPGIQIELIEA